MTTTHPPSFELQLPPGWIGVDVDADLAARLTRMAEEQVGSRADDELAAAVSSLVRRTVDEVERAGASFVAFYSELSPSGSDQPMLLNASLIVGTYDLGVGQVDAGSMSAAMLGGADAPAADQVSTVEIAGRPAVRLVDHRTAELVSESTDSMPMLVVQFFVPLDPGRQVTVLAFQTPNTALADEFTVLFDVIADSFEITAV